MNEQTDHQLLAAWSERRDEAAFKSLVQRHAGFVFGAALRRVGERGLAEEVAQDAFARLSQQAHRLDSHPTIAGWLHRATMLLALDRLRGRARRTRTLESFARMTESASPHDPWKEALPNLDEALDRLSASDREVIMLYYAERQTFSEMARRMESTADAVRMRTNRALESLSKLLRKKGAAIPAAMLAAGLSEALAQEIPATLATLAPAALSGLGNVSAVSIVVHAIHTADKVRVLGHVAVAAVLSGALMVQQDEIARARERLNLLEARSMSAVSIAEGRAVPVASVAAGGKADAFSFDLKQLGEDALDGQYSGKRRLQQALGQVDANNLVGLIDTVIGHGLMPEPRNALLQRLLKELRKRDPVRFLECSMKVFAQTIPDRALGRGGDYGYGLRAGAEQGFRDWMAVNPADAAGWAASHEEDWKEFGGSPLRNLSVAGLLQADPPRAYALLQKYSTVDCLDVLFRSRRSLGLESSLALAHWAAGSVTEVDKRRKIVRKALAISPFNSPQDSRLESVRPHLQALNLNAVDLEWVAARLALDDVFNIESDLSKVPEVQLAWLKSVVPAERHAYVLGAFGHCYQARQALIFLKAEFAKEPNDDLLAGYIESEDMRWHRDSTLSPSGGRHADTAFRLATQVRDHERRLSLLETAWRSLQKEAPGEAQAILEIEELDPADRNALQTRIAAQAAK